MSVKPERIGYRSVFKYSEMQMRACRVSGASDISYSLTLRDILPDFAVISAEMSVQYAVSSAECDLDAVPVSSVPGSSGDNAVRNGKYR